MTKLFEGAIKKARPHGASESSIIPTQYDISYYDMQDLMEMAHNGKSFEAIALAFDFGFVMGNRCTHRRKLKRL